MKMNVSVIVTVKNEGEAIRLLLDSLARQTRPADEIVICDGGSTDGTVAILAEYEGRLPLRLIVAPGSNISQGRNRAIAAAAGPIIAATDAGVVLSPIWLEEITRPFWGGPTQGNLPPLDRDRHSAEFKREHFPAVVSGWFEATGRTNFEVVMGATALPELKDIDPTTFLPSSRSVAFLKAAWSAVGGYPEWLDYSEDLVFDFALRQRYGLFVFAPKAVAYFRPRGSLRDFARQYYRYARGDGKADLWRKRHAIRYSTYLVGLPVLLWLIGRGRLSGWLLLLAGMIAYSKRPAQRLWGRTAGWPWPNRLAGFALIPVIRLVGDLAKIAGYPVGLWWRIRRWGRA
jgi:glycosyltransferase involved in cell wall biosynthesis